MRKFRGLTLIELIIAFFVFALLGTAAYFIITYGVRYSLFNATRSQMQQNARIGMERMVTELKNASYIPRQISGYSPDVPPSPVFIPFIYEETTEKGNGGQTASRNKLYFSEPIPSGNAANPMGEFNFEQTDNYRLVCYYVRNEADNGSEIETLEKSNFQIANDRISTLERLVSDLAPSPILDSFFQTGSGLNVWNVKGEFLSLPTNTNPAGVTNYVTNDAIITLPHSTDFIEFWVSHDEDHEFYRGQSIDFKAAYGDREDDICNPFTFNINMLIVQYPGGDLSNPRMEFKLESLAQVRSSYY